ncbi:MAG: zinc ribbon domain-containing protein [Acidobacteriaceae bacterium]|jgi:putative FmdB family regulatory protein
MPLYEYECKQCKKHTEKIQKFSDPEITKCPHCGGPLQRVVSAPAISFKGGGWFKDGYSHAKPQSSKEKESKSDSGAKSDSTTSSGSSVEASASSNNDAKPAAAPSAPAAPAASPTSSSSDKK